MKYLGRIQADLTGQGHRVKHLRVRGGVIEVVMQDGCSEEECAAAQADAVTLHAQAVAAEAAAAAEEAALTDEQRRRREIARQLMGRPRLFAAVVSSLARLLAADISDEADVIRRAAQELRGE